jgi:cell fate regulator YaaT (PSP1 superfamily)
MPVVVGVRFKPCGKIYDFEINGIDVKKGDLVVVESELGLNIGNVVIDRHSVEEHERELKKIVRKVTEEDLYQKQENKNLEREAMESCIERIMARGLPMKLISTEATLDRKRIIFYFTAEKRIDFRELVKDLAAKFKTRIEMRQIGVRDGAKITGSLGICGRELCCIRFLTSFEPISIKMAKKQELVLNTGKLSGVCGRLMCCLGFEYSETYSEEDINLTEANTITISEDTEVPELFIASSDSFGEVQESVTQPTQQPQIHENKVKHRKFKRHRKRRKRKPARQ